jgi:hypothetical protein
VRKAALLLLLVAVWYYAPDLALMADGSTRAATYQANGIFGAALCLLAREHDPSRAWRAVCDMAAFFFVMQPVCDAFWITEGAHTASVCDAVFYMPLSDLCGAGIVALAGWIYDNG